MPVDIMVPVPHAEAQQGPEYVKTLRQRLERGYDIVRTRLKTSAEREKRLYDRKLHGENLKKGALVWVARKGKKPGVCPKFTPKWRGPCLVTSVFNDVLLRIQLNAVKFATLHSDHVKVYRGKKRPRWLIKACKALKA